MKPAPQAVLPYLRARWYHAIVSIAEDGIGTLYLDDEVELTSQTTMRPAPDGRFAVGQDWDGQTPSDASVTPAYPCVIQSTWTYTVPTGIEGLCQLNLCPFDLFENSAPRPEWPVRNGSIETRPPGVSVTAEEEVSHLDIRTNYTCRVSDFNLVEQSAEHPEYNSTHCQRKRRLPERWKGHKICRRYGVQANSCTPFLRLSQWI